MTKDKTEAVKQKDKKFLTWNHTFIFSDLSRRQLLDCSMEFTFWDKEKFNNNDFLGGVRLNLGTGTCMCVYANHFYFFSFFYFSFFLFFFFFFFFFFSFFPYFPSPFSLFRHLQAKWATAGRWTGWTPEATRCCCGSPCWTGLTPGSMETYCLELT